jgi:dipeptidyl aminopeptidase/acylaminoacyl peptidase
MRLFCLALMASAAIAAPATLFAAPAATGPSRTFQPKDLFGLQYATDPQVRPDGKAIAYVRASYDQMADRALHSIWLVDPATGAQTPVSTGDASAGSPRWSPDGTRLAYVTTDENKRPQLYVRWMASGQSARVTDLPEAPDSISWSPDGREIALVMFTPDQGMKLGAPLEKPEGAKWAEPIKIISRLHYREDGEGALRNGFAHVFVVGADGGVPRQLTYGSYDDNGPLAWTPDGKSIVFASNRGKDPDREPLNSDLFKVSVADGTMAALTTRNGPDGNPQVSPDGRQIAYIGWDDKLRGYENARLYVMNIDGSGSRAVTSGLDRSIDDAQWAGDGHSLYVQYADHGQVRLARATLDGKLTPVADSLSAGDPDRPYAGGQFSVSSNGVVAFTSGDSTNPPDLSVKDARGERRLTRLNDSLFAGKTLAPVRHLAVSSSFDKRPIDAWLMLPPGADPAKKYPLILEIHGGPFAAYGPLFSSDDQIYASAGYAVVYANPRGSTSYGDDFANTINDNYPSQDYDDLMSAVDAAIADGHVDGDNLFVTGGSGGGVLTAWIVGKTHRFKAAVSQKPVINWSSFALTSDEYNIYDKYWFTKPPWEDPEGYWKRSPISLVGNVTTPTLVVVGEEDHRTPPSEAEQLYQALQLRGVPTGLIKVPGVGHGAFASRPSQHAAKANAILAWFDRYRTDRPGGQ